MTPPTTTSTSHQNPGQNRPTGILIMLFTCLMALTSVIILASTLTQTRITSLTIDGVHLTIWKLDSIRKNWSSIHNQIQKQTASLAQAEESLINNFPELSAADKNYKAVLANLNSFLAQFQSRIKGFDPNFATDINGKAPDYQLGRIQAERDRFKAQHPELDKLIISIETTHDEYQKSYVIFTKFTTEQNTISEKITEIKNNISASQSSIASVFSPIKDKVKPEESSLIESALYELEPTNGFLGKIITYFVVTQPEVLTLFLVILMGILGSSLQITHSFFKTTTQTSIGSYFLQVCVGAIAALIIFVIAKAGVPIITDTSKIGGDAPINPYFVSFIAIISGLLSDRAISAIRRQGERIFGPEVSVEPDRWLRSDMTGALAANNLSVNDIADYLGTSESTITEIIKGHEKATAGQQILISVYLRQKQREIFTDFPPDNTG